MSVTAAIAAFEVRQRLRRVSTWVYFVVFFGMALFFVLAAGGAVKGATVDFGTGGKVFINSPYSINVLETLIAVFGTPIVAAIAGQATFQDIDHNAAALFFTTPISKRQYLLGRLAGALAVCLLVYAAIGAGAAVAMHLPVLDAARLGPPPGAMAYLQPYLTVLVPNLFITGVLFCAISTLSRRMLPVYAGAVVLLIGYIIAVNLSDQVEHKTAISVLDPFGLLATDRITEYWTVDERNARIVPLAGTLLVNRLVWCGAALALAALTYVRFSFTEAAATPRRRERRVEKAAAAAPSAAPTLVLPEVSLDFSTRASLGLLWHTTRLQWKETVKSVVFLVIVLAGVLFIVSTAQSVGRLFGTPTWPVTYQVLELVGGSFTVFILAIITFYSGELVWRERDAKLDQIHDALPTPGWIAFASKWLALVGVQVLLLGIILVAGVLLQTLKGYHRYELGLYARVLFGIRLIDFASLCTLAMFVHVVVNQKYAGHFVMVGYWIVTIALPLLGVEHRMVRFASNPAWVYSDMNGFGHFVAPIVWFKLYWAALALLFAVATNLLWVRGVETGWRFRLRLARQRLSRPATAAALVGGAAFVGIGAFIYWNTTILNPYRTEFETAELSAQYERRYKAEHAALPQPRVVGASVHVDIFPDERRVVLRGSYQLQNEHAAPIDRVALNLPRRARIGRLSFGRAEREHLRDAEAGFYVYALGQPLAPLEKTPLEFEIAYQDVGFENGPGDTEVVHNGTFFNSTRLPVLGYSPSVELVDDTVRRKHGLPERPRMRDLDDPEGLANNYVSRDGDWITFDATVCTSPDQIAIAPGYLKQETAAEGRRCFRYEMDARILNFYAFISARYAVAKDAWREVPIEVYHHPSHDYDVERMIRGVKASLDYFTTHFGPYQHRQVRIIEFPRYQTFAQAFPNTIPYSEAIGFIARVDDSDPEDVDYPFYVTAHEIAHQWWAHQVIGGDVQGSTMLSESLSQYSALMVMKHAWGERAMRKYLRYALDRYLRGRAQERKRELPLMRVEDQNYIHYDKGTLVMYALQDAIGEETVNRALRKFLEATKFRGPPYPNTRAFMDVLRREAPDAGALIHDLFEEITLYELRAMSARAKALDGGRFEITVRATAKKLRAGDLGVETEIPIDDQIALGAVDENGQAIALSRVRVTQPEVEASFVVDRLPAKAGIDPLNVLIDRKPDDNVVPVEGP